MKRILGIIIHRLRTYFLTGLITLTPIVFTIFVVITGINYFDQVAIKILKLEDFRFPGMGLTLFFLCLILTGFITRYYIGRKVVHLIDYIMINTPFVKRFYNAIKQVSDAVLGRKTFIFKEVVMVEYPRPGMYAMGFLTADITSPAKLKLPSDQKFLSVFLPTTPNPTSGYVIVLPEKDVQRLNLTIEDAMKFIISAGAFELQKTPEQKDMLQ